MYFQEGKTFSTLCLAIIRSCNLYISNRNCQEKKNLSCYQHCVNEERAGTKKRVRKECSPIGMCLCRGVRRSEKRPVYNHYPELVSRNRYRQTPDLHMACGVTYELSQIHMGTLLQILAVFNSSNMSLLTQTAKESEVVAWTETCKLPHRDLRRSIVYLMLSNVSILALCL